MIDYSLWTRKKLLVKSLKLDVQNPRLSGFGKGTPTQPQILEYLLEHENIVQLSKDISVMGYLPNEEPIVFKEDGKYVVVEGNRRVSACKILLEPELIPQKNGKRNVIKRILNEFDNNIIKNITVIIAPNREAADVLIVNRHTKGSSIEKWDKTKQDKFFHTRYIDGLSIEDISGKFNLPKSAIKDSLIRFNVFEELLQLQLGEKDRAALADETKFNMTNVERFYKSKKGREFLGVEFSSKGEITHQLPKEEYHKRLTRIAVDVVNNVLNSRTYGDDKLQVDYLSKLQKEAAFDFSIISSKTFQEQYTSEADALENDDEDIEDEETPPSSNKNLNTVASQNKLIPSIAYGWKTGNVRIDRIFKELKEADLSKQFNATAILFRSYLDMMVYQFLQKSNSVIELIKVEQGKIDEDNQKRITRTTNYLISLGINEQDIVINDLKKALSFKSGVNPNWVPTLKQMLNYISISENILPDVKLRQALIDYIKGHEEYLGHNEFNLLVHNEYVTKDKRELKATWTKLFPLLSYINQQFD